MGNANTVKSSPHLLKKKAGGVKQFLSFPLVTRLH